MAVHVFPVESLSKDHNHLSMKDAYSRVQEYLAIRNQLGKTTNEYMHCADLAALKNAIPKFVEWAKQLPQDDPKLLWMRLHGGAPRNKAHAGTRGVSSEDQFFDWYEVFSAVHGKFPRNVVVMDVCWGASPSAPARMTGKTGNPTFLFGSVRSACPFEFDSAIGLLVGALARGVVPSVTDAKSVVRALNTAFPPDSNNSKPFFRVYWWTKRNAPLNCYPKLQGTKLTRVSQ